MDSQLMERPRTDMHTQATFQRFAAKVRVESSGCWQWTAALASPGKHHGGGYGTLKVNGRMVPAHRVGYELFVGSVPDGLVLDHLCRNPGCVNPDHLEPVTERENILRGAGPCAQHAQATHCSKGHPYDLINTFWSKRADGSLFRQCRECMRQRTIAKRKGGHANTRKTHCIRGHEFTPENTRYLPKGGRACRECSRLWKAERRRTRSGVQVE